MESMEVDISQSFNESNNPPENSSETQNISKLLLCVL